MLQNDQEQVSINKWPKLLLFVFTGLVGLLFSYAFLEALHRLGAIISPLLIPLIISLAIAYMLEPIVDKFEGYRFSRANSTLLTLLLSTIVLAIVLLFLLPNFWSQLSLIVTKLPTTIKSAADWAQLKFSYLQARNPELYQQVSQHISDYVHNPEGITGPIVNFVKNSFSQLGGFTASVLNLILIPLFVYYILVDFHKLSRTLYSVIPPRHSTTVSALFQQVDGVLRNFVRGQLLVCTAMSGLYVIGFLIIGVPMGFSLGILSGFGHLVPYFGTAAAAILAIGFTALDGHVWWHILVVIAMYPIVQTIEGFVLTPRILGEKLELHPSLVLVGIIIGHHLFGILGIALAAPVMACLKVFLAFLYHLYLNSNFYRQIPPFSPPNPMPVPEAKSITDELKVEIDIAPVTQNSVMQD